MLDYIRNLDNVDYSDIHIREGKNLALRQAGNIVKTDKMISHSDIVEFMEGVGRKDILDRLKTRGEVDFSVEIGVLRFRGNLFMQRSGLGLVLRKINSHIRTPEDLGLPGIVTDFARMSSGLVLITGPTGSGKSSSLAAIVDYINRNFSKHIICIEDPIEYYYEDKKSVISQRELGLDSTSFENALKYSLRQDPDVIVIGEVRDEETVRIAMRAAETGHLCFCTLHTLGAGASVERLIDMFDPADQGKVRSQLAMVLRGVVSQQLIQTKEGRKLVVEVLFCDKSTANILKEAKTDQLANYILTNKSRGMESMDENLVALYDSNLIDLDSLLNHALDQDYLMKKRGRTREGYGLWD